MNGFRLAAARGVRRPNGRGDRIQIVYEQLRGQIIGGLLRPGTRIVETEVAAALGVSRTPVRAALQRLETEGYVFATGHAQSRMCVAPLTSADAGELFAIIGEVESLAARHAAADPREHRHLLVARLRDLNGRIREAAGAARPDLARAFELDRAFHDVIVAAGAGPRLASLHAIMKPQIERYARVYTSAVAAEVARSTQEHEDIVAAIETVEPEGAAAAMRANWKNATQRLARVIESVGELGTG
jgi:DNA-binding GntR family transcriptional regulator